MVIRHSGPSFVLIRDYADVHNVDAAAYGANFNANANIQMALGDHVSFIIGGGAATNILAISGAVGGLSGAALTYAYGGRIV